MSNISGRGSIPASTLDISSNQDSPDNTGALENKGGAAALQSALTNVTRSSAGASSVTAAALTKTPEGRSLVQSPAAGGRGGVSHAPDDNVFSDHDSSMALADHGLLRTVDDKDSKGSTSLVANGQLVQTVAAPPTMSVAEINALDDSGLSTLDLSAIKGLPDDQLKELKPRVINKLSVGLLKQFTAREVVGLSQSAYESLIERARNEIFTGAFDRTKLMGLVDGTQIRRIHEEWVNETASYESGMLAQEAMEQINGLQESSIKHLDMDAIRKLVSDNDTVSFEPHVIRGIDEQTFKVLSQKLESVDPKAPKPKKSDNPPPPPKRYLDRLPSEARIIYEVERDFNRLSTGELQQLDASTLNGLTKEQLDCLDARVLNGLSEKQIGSLEARVLNNLKKEELRKLDRGIIAGLNNSEVGKIETRVIRESLLSDEALKAYDEAQRQPHFGLRPRSRFPLLRRGPIPISSPPVPKSPPPPPPSSVFSTGGEIGQRIMKGLSAEAFKALEKAELTPADRLAYEVERDFNRSQAVSVGAVSALSVPVPVDLNTLIGKSVSNSEKLKLIDAHVINNLSDYALSQLSGSIINGLNDDAIRNLDDRVINRLSHSSVDGLSAGTIKTWVESRKTGTLDLTANVLRRLSDDAFKKLKPEMFTDQGRGAYEFERDINRFGEEIASKIRAVNGQVDEKRCHTLVDRLNDFMKNSPEQFNDISSDVLAILQDAPDAAAKLDGDAMNGLDSNTLERLGPILLPTLRPGTISKLDASTIKDLCYGYRYMDWYRRPLFDNPHVLNNVNDKTLADLNQSASGYDNDFEAAYRAETQYNRLSDDKLKGMSYYIDARIRINREEFNLARCFSPHFINTLNEDTFCHLHKGVVSELNSDAKAAYRERRKRIEAQDPDRHFSYSFNPDYIKTMNEFAFRSLDREDVVLALNSDARAAYYERRKGLEAQDPDEYFAYHPDPRS